MPLSKDAPILLVACGLHAQATALRIDPRLRSSDDRLLVENRESACHPLIGGIVSRLRESDNAPTEDLVDSLRTQLTDPYFASWLRATDRWVNPWWPGLPGGLARAARAATRTWGLRWRCPA